MSSISVTPEQLLARTRSVRAIVRALLGECADDAVQDAWVAALETSPQPGRVSVRWLARVARRAGLDRRRRDRERRVRERRRERSSSAPPTDQLVAEAELQRTVVAAVVALPEPYRATIMLRFLRELSPNEVARAMDVPVDTVHTRLRRGLERLRAELRAHDDSDGWRSRLVAFAVPSRTVGFALGVLWMSAKVKWAGGVAAIVIAALWLTVDAAPLGAGGDDVSPPAEALSAQLPLPEAETVELVPARVAAPAPTFVVRGTVTYGGRPWRGFPLEARLYGDFVADGSPLAEVRLTTNAAGAFAWPLRRPHGGATLVFRAGAGATLVPATVVLHPEDPPPTELRLFGVIDEGRVRGRVLDRSGEPIAGAYVTTYAGRERIACDADGRYRIAVAATRPSARVVAVAPGHVAIHRDVSLADQHGQADFVLDPALTVRGRVVDIAGRGLAGASVSTYDALAVGVVTDEDGRFELSHLDPRLGEQRLRVRFAGTLGADTTIPTEAVGDPVEVVLRRGARIRGRVFGPFGQPVGGAAVHVGATLGRLGRPRTRTRADGTFRIDNVRRGPQEIRILTRRFACGVETVEVSAGEDRVIDLTFRLIAGHRLAGRVVDRDGAAVGGAEVVPQRGIAELEFQTALAARSDRDGAFELAGLPFGTVHLLVAAAGFEVRRERDVVVDREDVVVVLDRPGEVVAEVAAAAIEHRRETEDTPVGRCELRCRIAPLDGLPDPLVVQVRSTATRVEYLREAKEGVLHVRGLPAGRYVVKTAHAGRDAFYSGEIEVDVALDLDAEVLLPIRSVPLRR